MSKRETSVHFRVPNNAKGRAFIQAARSFKNPETIGEVTAFRRGSRKAAKLEGHDLNSHRDMPSSSKHVEGFAVYLRHSKRAQELEAAQREFWQQATRRWEQDRARKAVTEFCAGEGARLEREVFRLECIEEALKARHRDSEAKLAEAESKHADLWAALVDSQDEVVQAEARALEANANRAQAQRERDERYTTGSLVVVMLFAAIGAGVVGLLLGAGL
jgi:hypothetical protein